MTNFIKTSYLFAALLAAVVFLAGANHYQRRQNHGLKLGEGSIALKNAFNPTIKQLLSTTLAKSFEFEEAFHPLESRYSNAISEAFENLRASFRLTASDLTSDIPLHLTVACLLAPLFLPLAALVCCVGSCIACSLCCVACVVTLLLVILLVALGLFLLYSGPLAGNGPITSEPVEVVQALVHKMAFVSNQTLASLVEMLGQDKSTQSTTPLIEVLHQVVSVFASMGSDLSKIIDAAESNRELRDQITGIIDALNVHIHSMSEVLQHQLAAHLPFGGNGMASALKGLMEQIEDALESMQSK